MSTRLKAGDSPGRALRRACSDHATKALVCLKRADQPEAAHNVRREIKKMRAIFRLAEDGLRRRDFRKIARSMRLSAKPLAAARDARVMRQAFEMLAGSKVRNFPEIRSALKSQSGQAGRDYDGNDLGSIARLVLKQTSRLVEDLDLRQVHWPEIRTRLRKSYSQGRKAYLQSLKQPSPERLHEWRKRVKNFWYQLHFLSPQWPRQSEQLAKALDRLGELLGNSHDLVLLHQFANERCRNADETSKLQLLIAAKSSEYGVEIKRLGAMIYSQSPEAVSAKLEAARKSWRKHR
jgi:CHAD domain-containing protein